MFRPFHQNYLQTTKNDPMQIDDGLYVIVPFGFEQIFIRVNLGPYDLPLNFNHVKHVVENMDATHWSINSGGRPKVFHGGNSGIDQLAILHDAQQNIKSTIKAGGDGVVSLSFVDDLMQSKEEFYLPSLWKFVFGYQVIDEAELAMRLLTEEWSILRAPAYLAYGQNTKAITSYARKLDAPKSFKSKGRLGIIGAVWRFVKTLTGFASDIQLSAARAFIYMHYAEHNKQPYDYDYLEKVIEVHLAVRGKEIGDVTNIYTDLARDKIDQNYGLIDKRWFKIPFIKENRRLRKVFEEIGVNRYAYDYATFNTVVKDRQASTGMDGSAKKLIRDIDTVGEIVKDNQSNSS
ncbi:hypothetical protein [Pararhizobium sp. IMCC21322]|uniref:hypothetical protein n=1 Tax=Pararhizobium sp. IMCC21322 TaxID=3067903 RepID=UPI002741FFA9|nr:hypothetical protein [Pararhizobium sp. IMCC21322]